jgi:pimeloyl-ACP methyl ester carboxylesterase
MVRESHLEIAGRRVRYLDAGAGWPLVLVHAFPLNADMWRPQLDRVPRESRFIAPDVRGFGPAAIVPSAAPTLDQMARDIVAVLDELEIDRAAVGGLSMGGYLAMALLRVAPERVTALVLANTRPQADTPEGRQGREKMIELARTRGPAAIADQMLPKLLGETSLRARPHLPPMIRRMVEGNPAEGIASALHAMKERPDSTAQLAAFNGPALVIAGEEDTLIPVSESEAMHALMPRSHLVLLPSAGHLSSVEVPDDFSEALGNFLNSHL